MLIEKIIPTAFAQEANKVIENLADSDAKLQELNTELIELTTEYTQSNAEPIYYSFFNIDNVYFWFTVGGLLLLAVGLLFLLIELKKYQPKKVKIKEPKPRPIKEKKIKHRKEEPAKVEQKIEEPKEVKKKPVKVKVIKVK